MFLTFPTDFRQAILTTVNAGLDSDSTAGMVGALVAANCSLDVIPTEWRGFSPHFSEAFDIGRDLFQAFTSQAAEESS